MYSFKNSVNIFEDFFNLNNYNNEYVKKTMRFIKPQIHTLIKYFDIISIQ